MQLNEKPIRLVEYLIALTKTTVKTTRDLNEYNNILWLHEIPREPKHCYTRAWGEEDEHGDYCWVEVKKFNEPHLPKIPEKLNPWVNYETLHNRDDIPDLYNSLTIEKEDHDQETGEQFKNVERLNLKH